jgi:hypothetical protein
MNRRRWLPLLLLAHLACRRGQVAGSGTQCDDRRPCRFGYTCQGGTCQPAPVAPGEDARRPLADTLDAFFAPADSAAPDGALDLGPAPPPPSLERCLEYAYDGQPGECASQPYSASYPALRLVAFSLDGSRLATQTSDWLIKTWDVLPDRLMPTGRDFNTGPANDIALSPRGEYLAVRSLRELAVWRIATGVKEVSWVPPAPPNAPTLGRVLGFAADGDRFLMFPGPEIWSVSRRGLVRTVPAMIDSYVMVDPWPTPGSPWWAANQGRMDEMAVVREVTFIDLDSDTVVKGSVQIPGFDRDHPPRMWLGPGARTLAVWSLEGVSLWDVADKARPRRHATPLWTARPGESINEVSFSSTGRHALLSIAPLTPDAGVSRWTDVIVYELPSGREVLRKKIEDSGRAVFVKDDSAVAIKSTCPTFRYCRD